MNERTKCVLLYVGITYGLTLGFHLVLQAMGGVINPVAQGMRGLQMVFPLLAVLIVEGLILRRNPFLLLRGGRKPTWFAAAALIPLAMTAVVSVLGLTLWGLELQAPRGLGGLILGNIAVGLTIATVSALAEEIGWRGFLYRELAPLGKIRSALVTAAIWALWHLPVIYWYMYPGDRLRGVLVFTGVIFALSLVISYIRVKSDSVIAAALLHGMANAVFFTQALVIFVARSELSLDAIRLVAIVLAIGGVAAYEQITRMRRRGQTPSGPLPDFRHPPASPEKQRTRPPGRVLPTFPPTRPHPTPAPPA